MRFFSDYSRFVCNGYFHSYSALDTKPIDYIEENKLEVSEELRVILNKRAITLRFYLTGCYDIINGNDKMIETFENVREELLGIEDEIRENYMDFVNSNNDFNFTPKDKGGVPDDFEDQFGDYCITCGHPRSSEEYLDGLKKVSEHYEDMSVSEASDLYLHKCRHCSDGKVGRVNKYGLKAEILKHEIEALARNKEYDRACEKVKLKIEALLSVDPFYKDIYLDSFMEIGDSCRMLCGIFSSNGTNADEGYHYAKIGIEAYENAEKNDVFFGEYHNCVDIIRLYLEFSNFSENAKKEITVDKLFQLIEKSKQYAEYSKRIYKKFFPENYEREAGYCDFLVVTSISAAVLLSPKISAPEKDIEKMTDIGKEFVKSSNNFSHEEKRGFIDKFDESIKVIRQFFGSDSHQTTAPVVSNTTNVRTASNISNVSPRSNISNIPGSAPVSNISSSQPAQRSYPSSNSRSDGAIFRDPERPQSRYEDVGTVFRDPEREREVRNSSENEHRPRKTGFCYIATAVYGSYDCPEVWVLRRFRDYSLAKTWYGRTFIKIYYKVSPVVIKIFGKTSWFNHMWRSILDNMVNRLQDKGVENTPYED